MNKKKSRRLLAVLTAWLMVVQMAAPTLVLAEELPEEPEPVMEMETGAAEAEAEAAGVVNTTAVESELEVVVESVEGEQETVPFDLSEPEAATEAGDLREDWQADKDATESSSLELSVQNEAKVAVTASASANTGNNIQVSELPKTETKMVTGEAVAVANAVGVVNTTLVNSELEVGSLVILTPYEGNVVMDPLRLTANEVEGMLRAGSLQLKIDNAGQVVVKASAQATTGGNVQETNASALLETGEAVALSSTAAVVGLTAINAQIVEILVQNLWLWEGMIYNWEYPGSVQAPGELFGLGSAGSIGGCSGECYQDVSIAVENSAQVEVVAEAIANTGGNTQQTTGKATMKTGSAYAGATATAVVNTTLVNSRLSLLHLLLFAPWKGDLIFAYPDLVTTVSAPTEVEEGEAIVYSIAVTNVGHKRAANLAYGYRITNDEHLVGNEERTVQTLGPGEVIEWTVEFDTSGRGGHLVTLSAVAQGTETEVSESNNTARAVTMVRPRSQAESTKKENNQEVPVLRLAGGHNAGGGVYAGDGVRYSWKATNEGPITAHEVLLIQEFYSPAGRLLSQAGGPVGELALNQVKNVSFVMTPSPELLPAEYYTVSYLVARNDDGVETKSNVVELPVRLIARGEGLVSRVAAAEGSGQAEDGEEVLGASMEEEACQECQALPWYLGVAVGSAAYYVASRRRLDGWKVFRWGLTLPLTGYAGLLWVSKDCAQGLVLTESLGIWCRYFLPISYGGYGVIGAIIRKTAPLFAPLKT